ncbi:MAG: dihydropteroate synthase [Methanobacteriota archaeon]|jgi:dihydropteroate synthase|uniref:dihydropteroate synthase n=1 Tax=Halorutilus salinus TaxID=2487751 RepID=A0A9Q4C484_9EURY|nr:dihydropteroate synthase [Halorutilus salinus]MCX2818169.1 dihydropteroate synthase [Halorutilus salinus]
MEPREAVEYLDDLRRFGVKEGFGRTRRLLDAVGKPHVSLDTVTVGGSNGKGSVARTVESCLRHDGRSTGLYTSPHMYRLGERVRVDGTETRRSRIRGFVERVRPTVERMIAEGDAPTFFETTTVMALDEFARRGVDDAVLEVGLGGRLDTTRLADSDIAAVTSVALEHTDVLGETVAEVAEEVAGVVPEDGVCVTAATGDALDVVRSKTDERGSKLRAVGEDIDVESPGRDGFEQRLVVDGEERYDLRTPLLGEHQARNVAVAVGVAEELGVSPDGIRKGVRRADWRGRFEVVEREPLVVLDAAHNPAAVDALVSTLDGFDYDELSVVFGCMSDKDNVGMASCLSGADRVYTVEPSRARSEDADSLAGVFEGQGVEATPCCGVAEGVRTAVDAAGAGDAVVVAGSLWTVAEARRLWTEDTTAARFDGMQDAGNYFRTAGFEPHGTPERTVRIHDLTRNEALALERTASRTGASVSVSRYAPDTYVDAVVTATPDEYRALVDEGVVRKPFEEVFGEGDGTDVMGILNVTPDSFYDGGEHDAVGDAVERAYEMNAEGADIIDIGGESTRPGAEPVPVEEELDRVLPVVERIADDLTVSVDTRKPEVAREALEAGAEILNDVTGLADPETRRVAAEAGCKVVAMDSVNVPVDPSAQSYYDDVVTDVARRLSETALQARRAGVSAEDIVLDPGVGFGKGTDGDLELLRRTDEIASLGYPVLYGCSRKSFLGSATGEEEDDRLAPSVAAHFYAALRGASYVRVHDVAETARALRLAESFD